MIRMIRYNPYIRHHDCSELVGKIVFKASTCSWPGMIEPRYVRSTSGTRVYLDRIENKWIDGLKTEYLDAVGLKTEAGFIGMTSVACVCDTVADANIVIAKALELMSLDGRGADEKRPVDAGRPELAAMSAPTTPCIGFSNQMFYM